MTSTRAIVAHGPFKKGQWKLEDLKLRDLGEDEVLVKMVASGLCHTDLVIGDEEPGPGIVYPKVLGHEGSGIVQKVGSKITHVSPGDPVLLSYTSCATCLFCKSNRPNYCVQFIPLNIFGQREYVLGEGTELNVDGSFFGQSSFASLAIAKERSVVNVQGLVSEEELKVLAPLGCGVQTGAGAVVNTGNAGEEDVVVVLGLGGVGLSAVMAAKYRNCKTIIGIDKIPSRLALAQELGCHHVINTTELSNLSDIVPKIQSLSSGLGCSLAIETTGYPPLIAHAVEFTANAGKILQVGVTPPTATLDVPLHHFVSFGKVYMGAIEGDSVPAEMVPKMIGWWREGKFPLERLVGFFEAEGFEKAVNGMKDGSVVKPILLW